jgi:hypothetical protein
VFDDAAGPGYGNLAGEVVLAAQLGADQQDESDQVGGGLGEYISWATGSPAFASSLMAGASAAKSGPGVLSPRLIRSANFGVPQISPTF